MTLFVILITFPFRKKGKEKVEVDSRKKIIIITIILAVIFSFFYVGIARFFISLNIDFGSWISVFGLVQVRINQFWMLLFLFLFGLYVYKKDWLVSGDIGSWKMWGTISAVLILISIYRQNMYFPILEKFLKVSEHNSIFQDKIPYPAITDSLKNANLFAQFTKMSICFFLLMFFLSFARKYFNKPNKITAFCSKHSINVYILHLIPVLILQYAFNDLRIAPILKIIIIFIIVIPSCLWLSYRLVYPHPVIAISFFVTLKIVSLFIGFDFYYIALLSIIFISFAGAVFESIRLLMSAKTGRQSR